jgi:hypothetical protein
MNDEILNPTPPEPEPAENLTPEVSFVRGFLGRVSALLRADADQKAKLTGAARLSDAKTSSAVARLPISDTRSPSAVTRRTISGTQTTPAATFRGAHAAGVSFSASRREPVPQTFRPAFPKLKCVPHRSGAYSPSD